METTPYVTTRHVSHSTNTMPPSSTTSLSNAPSDTLHNTSVASSPVTMSRSEAEHHTFQSVTTNDSRYAVNGSQTPFPTEDATLDHVCALRCLMVNSDSFLMSLPVSSTVSHVKQTIFNDRPKRESYYR